MSYWDSPSSNLDVQRNLAKERARQALAANHPLRIASDRQAAAETQARSLVRPGSWPGVQAHDMAYDTAASAYGPGGRVRLGAGKEAQDLFNTASGAQFNQFAGDSNRQMQGLQRRIDSGQFRQQQMADFQRGGSLTPKQVAYFSAPLGRGSEVLARQKAQPLSPLLATANTPKVLPIAKPQIRMPDLPANVFAPDHEGIARLEAADAARKPGLDPVAKFRPDEHALPTAGQGLTSIPPRPGNVPDPTVNALPGPSAGAIATFQRQQRLRSQGQDLASRWQRGNQGMPAGRTPGTQAPGMAQGGLANGPADMLRATANRIRAVRAAQGFPGDGEREAASLEVQAAQLDQAVAAGQTQERMQREQLASQERLASQNAGLERDKLNWQRDRERGLAAKIAILAPQIVDPAVRQQVLDLIDVQAAQDGGQRQLPPLVPSSPAATGANPQVKPVAVPTPGAVAAQSAPSRVRLNPVQSLMTALPSGEAEQIFRPGEELTPAVVFDRMRGFGHTIDSPEAMAIGRALMARLGEDAFNREAGAPPPRRPAEYRFVQQGQWGEPGYKAPNFVPEALRRIGNGYSIGSTEAAKAEYERRVKIIAWLNRVRQQNDPLRVVAPELARVNVPATVAQ